MLKRLLSLALWSILLFASLTSHAKEIQGNVIAVLDGDTIIVLTSDNMQYRIRFDQIDAPEKSQAYGQVAKKYLSSLIYKRTVDVNIKDKDRYGRSIGEVFYKGENINLRMIQEGYAWAYQKYVTDRTYLIAQEQAFKKRKGLWQTPNPTPPWEYRHK